MSFTVYLVSFFFSYALAGICDIHRTCGPCRANEFCKWCNQQGENGPCVLKSEKCFSGVEPNENAPCLSITCSLVYNCGGRGECIGINECDCNEGYIADADVGCAVDPDYLANRTTAPASPLGIIAGSVIGGVVVLVVMVLVILVVVKQRKGNGRRTSLTDPSMSSVVGKDSNSRRTRRSSGKHRALTSESIFPGTEVGSLPGLVGDPNFNQQQQQQQQGYTMQGYPQQMMMMGGYGEQQQGYGGDQQPGYGDQQQGYGAAASYYGGGGEAEAGWGGSVSPGAGAAGWGGSVDPNTGGWGGSMQPTQQQLQQQQPQYPQSTASYPDSTAPTAGGGYTNQAPGGYPNQSQGYPAAGGSSDQFGGTTQGITIHEVTRDQAESELSGGLPGQFVVRPSSQAQCVSLSYRNKDNGRVEHLLIRQTAAGWIKEGEENLAFPYLISLLRHLQPGMGLNEQSFQ